MSDFKPEYIDLNSVNLPAVPDDDIIFWNVEGYPVIDVLDGRTGMIALFGKIRAFPPESAERNGWEVTKDEFFKLFPDTREFFEYPKKQVA